jgi:hypothetical protein
MRVNRAVRCGLAVVLVAGGAAACGPAPDQPEASGTPQSTIRFEDDFATDPFPRWEPETKSAWSWKRDQGVFELVKNVPLTESVRAPFNRNLIKGVVVGDFRLDADLQSTTRDYPHRSLCLFFGYQDPEHMYYVHFGRQTDDTSNRVFIVNGEDRAPISAKTTAGTRWDDRWHHARIVRKDATINVFFDDMTTPAMTASDATFASGQVGIGSFDDTGRFDNVSLIGQPAPQR